MTSRIALGVALVTGCLGLAGCDEPFGWGAPPRVEVTVEDAVARLHETPRGDTLVVASLNVTIGNIGTQSVWFGACEGSLLQLEGRDDSIWGPMCVLVPTPLSALHQIRPGEAYAEEFDISARLENWPEGAERDDFTFAVRLRDWRDSRLPPERSRPFTIRISEEP
jgi:hypothetical protein